MSTHPFVPNLKEPASQEIAGPGSMLRRAREAKNISIDQIANQLKLTSRMVKQIEEDDYSHINSLIFLKGYLRNYAQVLGVDSDPILAQIDTRQFEQNRERPPAIEYKVKLFTREQVMRWMTTTLGIALVGLVLMWWHSHSTRKPLTLLPETHTMPTLPANPGAGTIYGSDSPLYDDEDLQNTDTTDNPQVPAPPKVSDEPEPVESFTYYNPEIGLQPGDF